MRSAIICLIFLLASLFLVCVPAVEAGKADAKSPAKSGEKPAEIKAKVRALQAEAAQVGDLWTALQLESYAQQNLSIKLPPVLGSSDIIGDPLFAFPQRIGEVIDHGDFIGVFCGQRFHLLAPDGRPLALSTPLSEFPERSALSFDGRFAVAVNKRWNMTSVQIAVRAVPNGAETMHLKVDCGAKDQLEWWGATVANDGSAAAIGIANETNTNRRIIVARANGPPQIFKDFIQVLGVGPGGAWTIATPLKIDKDSHRLALIKGDTKQWCSSAAIGPGVAAVISTGITTGLNTSAADKNSKDMKETARISLVAGDGALSDLNLPVAVGTDPTLASVGQWLVVGSGANAKSMEQVDLLGQKIADAGDQPYTTLLYRWADLIADHHAPPATQITGFFTVADHLTAGIFTWTGRDIAVVDLSGKDSVSQPWATASDRVALIRPQNNKVVVHLGKDDTWDVYEQTGALIWNGEGTTCDAHEANTLIVRHSSKETAWTYLIVHPDIDPLRRTQTPMTLGDGWWDMHVDRYGRRIVATQGNLWKELDPISGTITRTGDRAEKEFAGQVVERTIHRGRFCADTARLVAKNSTPADPTAMPLSAPQDAWRVGNALLVLDASSKVLISGKKRGVFQSLGSCEYAEHFGQATDGVPLLDGARDKVGMVIAGPALKTDFPGHGEPGEQIAPGPWRINGTQFVIPHGGIVSWDASKAGFYPLLLRSPPGQAGTMLVITESLLIDLDAGVAKLVAKSQQ